MLPAPQLPACYEQAGTSAVGHPRLQRVAAAASVGVQVGPAVPAPPPAPQAPAAAPTGPVCVASDLETILREKDACGVRGRRRRGGPRRLPQHQRRLLNACCGPGATQVGFIAHLKNLQSHKIVEQVGGWFLARQRASMLARAACRSPSLTPWPPALPAAGPASPGLHGAPWRVLSRQRLGGRRRHHGPGAVEAAARGVPAAGRRHVRVRAGCGPASVDQQQQISCVQQQEAAVWGRQGPRTSRSARALGVLPPVRPRSPAQAAHTGLLLLAHPWACRSLGPPLTLPRAPPSLRSVGMVFMPNDDALEAQCKGIYEAAIAQEGMALLGWRQVPVDHAVVGRFAKATQPRVWQVLVKAPQGVVGDELERALFVLRKRVERARDAALPADRAFDFYTCSLSGRTIVYKARARARAGRQAAASAGAPAAAVRQPQQRACHALQGARRAVLCRATHNLALAAQCSLPRAPACLPAQGMLRSVVVGQFYKDLRNTAFETAFAIYHRRFSTNTTPKWPLAQPFRILGHNGARVRARVCTPTAAPVPRPCAVGGWPMACMACMCVHVPSARALQQRAPAAWLRTARAALRWAALRWTPLAPPLCRRDQHAAGQPELGGVARARAHAPYVGGQRAGAHAPHQLSQLGLGQPGQRGGGAAAWLCASGRVARGRVARGRVACGRVWPRGPCVTARSGSAQPTTRVCARARR